MNSVYQIGLGKADMTAFIPGVGMMGYGQFHNVVKEIGTGLSARAVVIQEVSKRPLIFVHLEQAFVTIALKQEIVNRMLARHPGLALTHADILMTAQHTHSAPGGYSHYPFYNFTIPGFQTQVFDRVATASIEAIELAMIDLAPATLAWGETEISLDKEVAFNRSMTAYKNNPDVEDVKLGEKEKAVSRTMEGLFIRSTDGKLRGMLNFFGVHCTSVSSYNTRIHHDNKGVAAALFDKKKKLMRGKFDDQYESAEFNGEIQFREAEKIVSLHPISGEIRSAHTFVNMSKRVAPPAHGVSFFMGTLEGPGMPHALGNVMRIVARVSKTARLIRYPEDQAFFNAHGRKDVMLDHRTGTFAVFPTTIWNKLPPLPDKTLEAVRKTAKTQSLKTLPWVPGTIPFQMLALGNVLLIAVPGEITTNSARRLRRELTDYARPSGFRKVIIASYANCYMGYITTPEEYDLQCYEGGHNVHGRATHTQMILAAKELFDQLSQNIKESGPQPLPFPADELARRSV
jgi:neutral ceramidase